MEYYSGFIRAVDQQGLDHIAPIFRFTDGRAPQDFMKHISEAWQGLEHDHYSIPYETTVKYRPSFQNLERMCLGREGKAVAKVNTES